MVIDGAGNFVDGELINERHLDQIKRLCSALYDKIVAG